MNNKKRLLQKTLKRIKTNPRTYSLARFKRKLIDRWSDDYYVDLDIQRNPYFTYKHAIDYLDSWFNGSALTWVMMVDIDAVWDNIQQTGKKGSKTYNYFKVLVDDLKSWLSVDGNNRNHAWFWFFNDMFKLPIGFDLPLWNLETNEQYYVTLTKPMTYSDIINDAEIGKGFEEYMKNGDEKIRIDEITQCTKPQLHNIFRCVNQGKKLEPQEDRNCIDTPIAEWVRRQSNDDEKFGKFYRNEFNEKKINLRAHEHFTAYTLSMINDFGNMFPSGFGEKPTKTISEDITTSHYEKDTFTEDNKIDTKRALTKLKGYIKWTKAGEYYVGSNLQLSRALIMLFHKINRDYDVDNWDSVYEWVDNFHTEQRVNNDTFKFPHISEERTYNDIIKSGVGYLSVIYQLFASQLILLELNGIIRVKQARAQFNSNMREDLYKKQSGICPLTDNTITEWNNTSKYHVDHKIPISKWLIELHGMNPNDISNLQLVEKTANLKKSNFF